MTATDLARKGEEQKKWQLQHEEEKLRDNEKVTLRYDQTAINCSLLSQEQRALQTEIQQLRQESSDTVASMQCMQTDVLSVQRDFSSLDETVKQVKEDATVSLSTLQERVRELEKSSENTTACNLAELHEHVQHLQGWVKDTQETLNMLQGDVGHSEIQNVKKTLAEHSTAFDEHRAKWNKELKSLRLKQVCQSDTLKQLEKDVEKQLEKDVEKLKRQRVDAILEQRLHAMLEIIEQRLVKAKASMELSETQFQNLLAAETRSREQVEKKLRQDIVYT